MSIEEAIGDFLGRFAVHWRREKARQDLLEQRDEIRRYHDRRAREEGEPYDMSTAAEEWCRRHAAMWRAERESLDRSGFLTIRAVARGEAALHIRPWSAVAATASRYDCDLYLHVSGMSSWNFLLEGRPFVNVKSIVALLSLGVALGDTLEFVATGAQAAEALEAVRAVVEEAP